MVAELQPGLSFPLGAEVSDGGVNFALYAPRARLVELVLFDAHDSRPDQVLPFDPARHRQGVYWCAFAPGLRAGQRYGFRVHGAWDPARGLRFDAQKLLLDPYARCVSLERYQRTEAEQKGNNAERAPVAVVVDPRAYDWEGDRPLGRSRKAALIYELHIGGFTRHPSSAVPEALRGTFRGAIERLSWLRELGVTAVQLMPIQQFDPQDAPPGLENYWGYSPMAYFAPHSGYASGTDPQDVVNEFREFVKAAHREGIEVILDVVFNHTCEGNSKGPTLSFRGLANDVYYILRDDRSRYADFTGCGNTLNANHTVVRRLILDCLRYWVREMHVDGFRFDLASALTRGESGEPLPKAPLIADIASDPQLAACRLIAEAWDAGGLYQVGRFGGPRWAELNGKFRDDVRRFVIGDSHSVAPLAQRIVGSPDLYAASGRSVQHGVNFLTSHDGFTLHDLSSYSHKHNLANGENNRDGHDANYSWNCGVEGPTGHPLIAILRLRQTKNLISLLLLSQGTPFWLMGDELQRTQQGNNNAYCQNNPVSWLDWSPMRHHAGLLRFLQELWKLRRRLRLFAQTTPWTEAPAMLTWHGVRLGRPDWSDASHSLAYSLRLPDGSEHLHVLLNAFWEALVFELPPLPPDRAWHRIVHTGLSAPEDIYPPGKAPQIWEAQIELPTRSICVLWEGTRELPLPETAIDLEASGVLKALSPGPIPPQAGEESSPHAAPAS